MLSMLSNAARRDRRARRVVGCLSLLLVPSLAHSLARCRSLARSSSSVGALFHQPFSFIPLPPPRLCRTLNPLQRRPHLLAHLWHTFRNIYRSFHPPFVLGQARARPSIASALYNRLSDLSDVRLLPNRSTHSKIKLQHRTTSVGHELELQS